MSCFTHALQIREMGKSWELLNKGSRVPASRRNRSREGVRENSIPMTAFLQVSWLPKFSDVAFQTCRWGNTCRAGQFLACGLPVVHRLFKAGSRAR